VSRRNLSVLFLLAFVSLASLVFGQTDSAPIKLSMDATGAARHILHVRLTMPAVSGKTTLAYPKWIPGEHGPTGPIGDVVNLHFTAGGAQPWQRDDVDMYAFHLQVPPNTALEAQFDVVGASTESEFLLGNSATRQQMALNWNQVVLYPLVSASDEVKVQAQLTLPGGGSSAPRFRSRLEMARPLYSSLPASPLWLIRQYWLASASASLT
jgi:hypothetical protein